MIKIVVVNVTLRSPRKNLVISDEELPGDGEPFVILFPNHSHEFDGEYWNGELIRNNPSSWIEFIDRDRWKIIHEL